MCCVATCCAALQHVVLLRCNMLCCVATCCAVLQHVVLCVPTALASLVTGGGRTDKLVKLPRARSCAAATATRASATHSHNACRWLPARCGTCRVSSVSASCSSGSRKHTAQLARTLNVCARTRTHRSRTGTHMRAHTQTGPARGHHRGMRHATGQAALHRRALSYLPGSLHCLCDSLCVGTRRRSGRSRTSARRRS